MITKERDGHLYIKRAKWEKRKLNESDVYLKHFFAFMSTGWFFGVCFSWLASNSETFIGLFCFSTLFTVTSWIVYILMSNKRKVTFERIK